MAVDQLNNFNPLARFNQGFQSGQNIRQSQIQNEQQQQALGIQESLMGKAQGGTFDPAEHLEFQQLVIIDPQRAQQMQASFEALSDSRKKAYAEDMIEAKNALEDGDGEGFMDVMNDRLESISRLNGDPANTKFLINQFNKGEIPKLLEGLAKAEQGAISQGWIKAPKAPAARSVQSSKILDDGTVIQVLKSGGVQVNSPTGEVLTGEAAKQQVSQSRDQAFNRKKEIAKFKQIIARENLNSKVDVDRRSGIQKQNISRISALADTATGRTSALKKATKFKLALESGEAFSGAGRKAASFIPGVFSSQGEFDEEFNAFAEVAARQTLKASGETRPTDADVQGMKQAMFGIGRDEDVNVTLLNDFIESQNADTAELDGLIEASKSGGLTSIIDKAPQSSTSRLSDAELLQKYGGQ